MLARKNSWFNSEPTLINLTASKIDIRARSPQTSLIIIDVNVIVKGNDRTLIVHVKQDISFQCQHTQKGAVDTHLVTPTLLLPGN